MKLLPTEHFKRCHLGPPTLVQAQADGKLEILLSDPRHPSLQAKKMQGTAGIWELRVSRGYRLTCQIQGDLYVLRRVGTHDVLLLQSPGVPRSA